MKHLFVCMLCVFGCGGDDGDSGSGVDPGLALFELESSDIEDLCNYGEVVGNPRTVDCDGTEVSSNFDVNECVNFIEALPDTCPATVDDMEACMEAATAQSDDEICSLEGPPECDFLGDSDCLDI